MFKRILLALGLRKAPAPIQRYVAASSIAGGVPAIAYVLFKHRRDLASLLQRLRSGSLGGQKVITADV
jgi:hypothetical protein